jgi:hypothetical protein
MSTATTHRPESTNATSVGTHGRVLHLAFELGERTWKLGFTTGFGEPPRGPTRPREATTPRQRPATGTAGCVRPERRANNRCLTTAPALVSWQAPVTRGS